MALKIRPQQSRLGWPLTPDQVEQIDTMFETLFRAVRNLSGVTPSTDSSEPLAEQAVRLAGAAQADAADALETARAEMLWLGPTTGGATSSAGLTAAQVAARVTIRL